MPSERKSPSVKRTAFHDSTGDMILQSVEQHWRSLRKGTDVPQRIDLTPGPVSAGLAHCFVLERVTPSVARFRVAGQAIHTLLKMEPRGMPISALFTPAGRQMLAPIIHDVCENAEICEIPLIAYTGFGRSPLRGRLLLLPLRHDGDTINRMFGALVVDGKVGRQTLRFEFDQSIAIRTQTIQPVIRTVHEIMSKPDDIVVPQPKMRQQGPWPALRLVIDNS
jgi:hypothetical protein